MKVLCSSFDTFKRCAQYALALTAEAGGWSASLQCIHARRGGRFLTNAVPIAAVISGANTHGVKLRKDRANGETVF